MVGSGVFFFRSARVICKGGVYFQVTMISLHKSLNIAGVLPVWMDGNEGKQGVCGEREEYVVNRRECMMSEEEH